MTTTTTIRRARGLVFALALGGASIALAAGDGTDTAEVLNKLHHSNKNEIHMGKLAQGHGQSKEVKSFGQMLEKDHSAADKKVKSLASEDKLTLAEMPTDIEEMASIPEGQGFDLKFAEAMLGDHKKDIAAVTQARDATSDKKLKKLLDDVLPILKKHEQTAQKIIDSQSKNASR